MKVDIKIHTCFSSDSTITLSDMKREVELGTIDVVAINDHNEIMVPWN